MKTFVVAGFVFSLMTNTVFADIFSPAKVIDLVNQSRADAGVPALVENAKLTNAAEDKVKDMIQNDYFSHTSPNGVTPWYWLQKDGYAPKTAGENLAINFSSAKDQNDAWMASKGHRENILNTKYTETGVAVSEGKIDGEKSIVTVQFFGLPLGGVVADTSRVSVTQTPPVKTVTETTPLITQNIVQEVKGAADQKKVGDVAPVHTASAAPITVSNTSGDVSSLSTLFLILFSIELSIFFGVVCVPLLHDLVQSTSELLSFKKAHK
jgi:hypothetical protein